MKPIAEVYPDEARDELEHGSFYGPGDYYPLLQSLGYEILVSVDDKDYSGDSRILFADGEARGVLIFGWGSCSGCDALQACSKLSEIEELRDDLKKQIKWFETPNDALEYFLSHDWGGDYSWHQEETHLFIAEAMEELRGRPE